MYESITLVANLGGDPESRFTPSGKQVTNFNIATNRQWTDNNGEKMKETIWWKVSVWGKQAEACNTYLKKGSKVLVVCRMDADQATGGPRVWEAKDGTHRANYEVIAQTVRFLSSRGEETAPGNDSPFV